MTPRKTTVEQPGDKPEAAPSSRSRKTPGSKAASRKTAKKTTAKSSKSSAESSAPASGKRAAAGGKDKTSAAARKSGKDKPTPEPSRTRAKPKQSTVSKPPAKVKQRGEHRAVSTTAGALPPAAATTEPGAAARPAPNNAPGQDQAAEFPVPDFEALARNLPRILEEGGKALAATLKPLESGQSNPDMFEHAADAVSTLGKVAEYWLADPRRAI